MPYRNAVYWFIVVLVIDLAGFWPSYFSRLSEAHAAHHAHGIAMVLWLLLLIMQHSLVHGGYRALHRVLGRTSILLAPVVIVTAVWVNLFFIARMEPPYPARLLSDYWLGYFLALAFGILYVLALVNRRRVQHHARYMAATALVFLIPGLVRVTIFYLEPLIGFVPTILQITLVPLGIAAWLLFLDYRNRNVLRPNAVVVGLWLFALAAYLLLPRTWFWQEFTQRSAAWIAAA